jgi:nicotinate phosphoribosyltransferase
MNHTQNIESQNAGQLPLAKTHAQRRFWEKLQPVNRPLASDTYKRTMSGSSEVFANAFAAYNLAARRPFKEEGANNRLIVAGLEKMLYPWFINPVSVEEVEEAKQAVAEYGNVKKFPTAAWQQTINNEGRMPIDIYGLPGGQTILCKDGKHVPIMSVEGVGAIVSHLEPHLENMYEPIIRATKAKLFEEAVGTQFAEFGLRADNTVTNHATLLLDMYVGGGFTLTSDDQTLLLWPDLVKDIGTVGHEFVMAYQKEGLTLEEAQEKAYTAFVGANQVSALLPDVIHTMGSGLPQILAQIRANEGTGKIIKPRFDSGDVDAQTVYWKKIADKNGVKNTTMVVEDGYTPVKGRKTKEHYASHGYDPTDIFVGAGGYFRDGCTRDVISLAYKRAATMWDGKLEKSIKFSDSPGKESIPGQVRIYERGTTLIVAQAEETIDGKLLSQKLVENGRIVYNETPQMQRERAQQTWNKYDAIEYSPMTTALIEQRCAEKAAIVARFE